MESWVTANCRSKLLVVGNIKKNISLILWLPYEFSFTVERFEFHVSPNIVERGIDRTLLIYVDTLTNRDRNRELDRIQKMEEGTRRIKIKKAEESNKLCSFHNRN